MDHKNTDNEGMDKEKAEKKTYSLKSKRKYRKLKKLWEIFSIKKNNTDLVKTTITIKTEYLEKKAKILCGINFTTALITFFTVAVTAFIAWTTHVPKIISSFAEENQTTPQASIATSIIVSIAYVFIICLSLYNLYKQCKVKSSTDFVNEIVKEQYDYEEFTAIFIIKAMFKNVPKILVFRSKSWSSSYFLPYSHYNKDWDEVQIKEKLSESLAEQLEIHKTDFQIFDDFTNNTYVAIKNNPSHKSMSKINYKFFYVVFKNPYLRKKFTSSSMNHFLWQSKYELTKDVYTQMNNGDIVSIIDELSLINQSKIAFAEKIYNSYEVFSNYDIIWNITNECDFECPICATNSGKGCKCSLSYNEKLKVLLNLSSINSSIGHLDISGGDPLKNPKDRELIKKVYQILAYTDVRITTTGSALEKLSVNDVTTIVKKCDITYDIPYKVCSDKLQEYREYNYNYYNFQQLEKFSSSGINVEMNIHIPILPATMDEKLISMILEDLHKINPSEVKFIRLMPVGRMEASSIIEYNPKFFLETVYKICEKNNYKFNIKYNCSLGVCIKDRKNGGTLRSCDMLRRKLGIDCNGRVYSCIWGAYIKEFSNGNYADNPFYLGDLTKNTMLEILTSPQTQKRLKRMENNMKQGCRVCAYVNMKKDGKNGNDDNYEKMLNAEDPMSLTELYYTQNNTNEIETPPKLL